MKKIQSSIYKVKYVGSQKYIACENSIPDGRFWKGKKCNNYVAIAETSIAAVCSACVNKVVEPPVLKHVQEKSDKPRGWKFMKVYVHANGTVFHKGVEQPNLKGTLPVTDVSAKDTKKKMSKQEKADRLVIVGKQIQHLKAELFGETRKGKKSEIAKQLSKLNRELTKLSK
jgi:hypothetical protein